VDVPTTDTVTAYYVWATSTGDTVYTTSLNPSAGKFLWSSKNNTVYIEAGQTPNQAYAKHAYGTVSSATKKSYVYMGDYSSSTRYWRDESKDEIKIGTTVKRGSRLYGEYEGEHSFKTRVFLSTLTGENIFTSNEDRPTVVPVLYKQTEAMSEDGVATVAGRNIEISYDVVYKINGVYFIRNGHEFLNGSKTYYIRETYNVWDSELQKDVQLNADEYIEYGGWEKRARESGVGFNLDTGLYTEGDSCKIYILFAPIVKHDNVVYSCDDSKYVAASYSFLEQCNIQAWTTAPCYSAETMYTSSTDNHSHLYQTTADAADGKDGLSYRINTGTYSITSASGTTYYFKNI
ncbi:MAG: hypothetical protein IKA32_05200, partial [Lentisphaeria bacterium]|nr:hypothetical protein [Lentisphaeria bacterium]